MPTIEEYLQMLQTDPQAMKQAQMSGLLGGMGMGLLSAPGWRGVSNMGMAGYQGAMDGRASAQNAGLEKLKQRQLAQGMAGADMDFAAKKQASDDNNLARTTLQNFQMPSPLPSMSPTNANAQALAQAPKQGPYEQLMAKAEALEAKGLYPQAAPLRAQADKLKAKWDSTPRMGTDAQGNRYQFILDDQGNEKRLQAGPDKSKLHFVSDGRNAGIGLDEYTGERRAGGVPVSMAPGESARLALEQAKFGYQKGRDTIEDGRKATADAAGPKPERPTDQQLATQSYLARMRNASKTIGALEGGDYTPGIPGAILDAAGKVPVVGSIAKGVGTAAGNYLYPEAPSYKQAQSEWVRAKLRKESGAVIGKEEEEGEIRTYFPQPLDPPEVVKQKAEARAAVEAAMDDQAAGTRRSASGGPAVGTVVNGFKFKGGDPNKRENWVQQ